MCLCSALSSATLHRFGVALVVISIGTPAHAARQNDSDLILSQNAVYVIPDSLELTGFAISSALTAYGWSSRKSIVVMIDAEAEWQTIGREHLRHPVSAHLDEEANRIEVLDATLQEVLTFTTDGRLFTRMRIRPEMTIHAATRTAEGWLTVAQRQDKYEIFRISADGDAHSLGLLPVNSDNDEPVTIIQLSSASNGLLVAFRQFPYQAFRVSTLEHVAFPRPTLGGLDGSQAEQYDVSNWIALPLLYIGEGYIQTFADLAKARIVAIYDLGGNLVRERLFDIPIALQASNPDRAMLLGVTRFSEMEVRLYTWRWRINIEEVRRLYDCCEACLWA